MQGDLGGGEYHYWKSKIGELCLFYFYTTVIKNMFNFDNTVNLASWSLNEFLKEGLLLSNFKEYCSISTNLEKLLILFIFFPLSFCHVYSLRHENNMYFVNLFTY
jgi:hypothetical protein